MGVPGCARVCADVPGCARVCTSVRRCARVCAGVQWVGAGVHGCAGCAQLCAGVRRFAQEYACMCGMNFQNFFRRIESLHQRTLIRILYEFFLLTYFFLISFYMKRPLIRLINLCCLYIFGNGSDRPSQESLNGSIMVCDEWSSIGIGIYFKS